MNLKTDWYLKGYISKDEVKVVRFDGGIMQEKIVLVDAMVNLNRKNKYTVKGI